MAALTMKQIEGFIYEGPAPRRDVRWDDSPAGFGIRIYPSGRKSFLISYRIHNRKRQMTLGDVGVITLDEARKKAKKALAKLLDGIDPLEERDKAAHGEIMKSLADTYMSRYAKVHKKTWETDEKRIERHVTPNIGNRQIKSITRNELAALHSRIGATAPYEANRVIELLSKMFELAKQWGFLEENASNPAKGIKAFKEEKRDRWVTPEELPKLTQAIDREENFYARHAIWLYLLTGTRKSELLEAKWEDIDMVRRELRLPDTKAGRKHYIPLSDPALLILKNLPRLEGNPYIFPGQVEGQHLINIDKPWRRIKAQAGIEDVRLHDLRRTVGSWLAQSGNSLHLIGKVLNHSNQSTTAVYARFAQDHVRQALEDHGSKIMAIAGKHRT
jgi:integrase